MIGFPASDILCDYLYLLYIIYIYFVNNKAYKLKKKKKKGSVYRRQEEKVGLEIGDVANDVERGSFCENTLLPFFYHTLWANETMK